LREGVDGQGRRKVCVREEVNGGIWPVASGGEGVVPFWQ